MDINFAKEIVVYSDILNRNSGIHGWKSEESFPIFKITDDEKQILSNVIAIGQPFEGVGNKGELFDILFDHYDSFVKHFMLATGTPSYLFHCEHIKQIKNKLRTHKGILPKSENEEDSLQLEIPVINNYTTFAALIKINKNNINDCIKFFPDSQTSCIIISTREEIFTEEYLKSLFLETVTDSGVNFINYLKLVAECCSKGDIVCRIGGDGGAQEISFQFFCPKTIRDLLILRVNRSIGGNVSE